MDILIWIELILVPKCGTSIGINIEKTVTIGSPSYTKIGAHWLKFLDISNNLGGGVSYSAFLKSYKIEEAKSYFPYEWFDHVIKLNFPLLSPDESYSELKQKNVFEIRDKKDSGGEEEEDPAAEIGMAWYQELQDTWLQQGMYTFKDILMYYNNLDVGPFVQAVEKMQQFYFASKINLFKVAVSVPGIARQWLFQMAYDAKINFGLVHPQDNDFYYTIKQNIVGGPSIIFTPDVLVSGVIPSEPVPT